MKCVIGSDHGALELKDGIFNYLNSLDEIEVVDMGVFSSDSVDYPDISDRVTKTILSGEAVLGILCCGTGVGISMRANRSKGIRAALVHSVFTAEMAKVHNNANILCLGGRTTSIEDAISYVNTWLDADFEGGRHERRLSKLDQ